MTMFPGVRHVNTKISPLKSVGGEGTNIARSSNVARTRGHAVRVCAFGVLYLTRGDNVTPHNTVQACGTASLSRLENPEGLF